MGIVGALGLFGSIIFHELCHSLVARRFGLPMKSITLFVFGGVAEMDEEPPSPKAEFYMAIAGPLSSLVLGGVLFGLYYLLDKAGLPPQVSAILRYLGSINIILAAFNMVPAYPLDGGRVLRSALWKWKNDLKWSTRIASYVGSGFGFLLMALGIINIFRGGIIGGVWWIMIGLFVRNASLMSYRKVLTTRALKGEHVRRFMKENVQSVSANTSVQDLVEEYIYRYHFKMYPVLSGGKLTGCVTTRDVREVPREEWEVTPVGNVMNSCSDENTINPDADATEALNRMNKSGNSRLMVVEGDQLVGIIALKDLLEFLSLKLELEEGEVQSTLGGGSRHG
jgi:Zn-dependent protease/predicted transcriptional regulator